MVAETTKYQTMYQTLLMEQLKLKKWDSVASVLDSMASAPGMAPTLSQLLTVLHVRAMAVFVATWGSCCAGYFLVRMIPHAVSSQ